MPDAGIEPQRPRIVFANDYSAIPEATILNPGDCCQLLGVTPKPSRHFSPDKGAFRRVCRLFKALLLLSHGTKHLQPGFSPTGAMPTAGGGARSLSGEQ